MEVKNKKLALIVIIIFIVIFGFLAWEKYEDKQKNNIQDNIRQELENIVVENKDNNEINNSTKKAQKEGLIIVDYPLIDQKIKSPLVVKGKARGSWFFEASFPIILVNWDGLIIAEGIATAKDDWMTEDFVDFEAQIEFELDKDTYSNRGAIILKKDNPSGLPEYDDALEFTIFFKDVGSN